MTETFASSINPKAKAFTRSYLESIADDKDGDRLWSVISNIRYKLEDHYSNDELLVLQRLGELVSNNRQNQNNPYHSIRHHAIVTAYAFKIVEDEYYRKKSGSKRTFRETYPFFLELMAAAIIHDYDYGSGSNNNVNREENRSHTKEENSFNDAVAAYKKLYGELNGYNEYIIKEIVLATEPSFRRMLRYGWHELIEIYDRDYNLMNMLEIISDADMSQSLYISEKVYKKSTKWLEEEAGKEFSYREKLDFVEKLGGPPLFQPSVYDGILTMVKNEYEEDRKAEIEAFGSDE